MKYPDYFKSNHVRFPLPNKSDPNVLATPGMIGSWIDTLGTVVAAIGSTPLKGVSGPLQEDLIYIGNVLQGLGSALVVDSPETLPNDRVGSALESIGNLTVISGLLQNDENSTVRLTKQGNLLQALGGSFSLNYDGQITSINNIGNGLRVLGNSLQAISLKESLLETEEGQLLDVIGSWIQAVGSFIATVTYEGAETGG
ncbi:MAG: hypothetical protein ABS938_07680 [Psychrobacillus psychrodurans]